MNLSNIVVEKNISLPKPNFGSGRWQYEDTLGALEVGDSFAIDLPADRPNQTLSTLRATLDRYSKKLVHKYATRRINDGASVRVWRTA